MPSDSLPMLTNLFRHFDFSLRSSNFQISFGSRVLLLELHALTPYFLIFENISFEIFIEIHIQILNKQRQLFRTFFEIFEFVRAS